MLDHFEDEESLTSLCRGCEQKFKFAVLLSCIFYMQFLYVDIVVTDVDALDSWMEDITHSDK